MPRVCGVCVLGRLVSDLVALLERWVADAVRVLDVGFWSSVIVLALHAMHPVSGLQ